MTLTSREPATTGPIRVIVVDDHELYRRGLLIVLDQEPDIEVVGEVGDGDGAVALAAELAPDLVLMDVRMPRSDGIAACRAIKETDPKIRIVMLTASEDESDLYEAVKAGASGYLLKESSIDEVVAAIRATHEGQSLLNPTMAAKLLNEFATMARRNETSRVPRLTAREVDVLKLLAWGRTNREIADALFISEHTVKSHVANILEKLQLHSRLEAAMYAVREKLVDID
jgi:DNA-binding NarL/FixJ family response regulator